jgi:CDP-diacylglycerol--glycerol-3-phosphate 3-phosphatidyltransferase
MIAHIARAAGRGARRRLFGPIRAGYNEAARGAGASRRRPMNLPNALTLARIFLVPLLVVVLLTKFEGRLILGVRKELIGAAIFALAALTDWLDGYLARRRQQITTLGQMMDPIADKLLVIAALISLVQMDLAPAWMVALIVGRDFAVTGLRSIAYARGQTISASPLGKFKMVAQVVAILLLILGRDHLQGFFVLGRVALWVVVVAAIASAVDYYRRFNHLLSPKVADIAVARRRTATPHKKAGSG